MIYSEFAIGGMVLLTIGYFVAWYQYRQLKQGYDKMKIKPGDLICYNAAGQKHRTVGLVLDLREDKLGWSANRNWKILIQWGCVGSGVLPRTTFGHLHRPSEIRPGDVVWHEFGNWFEVVK